MRLSQRKADLVIEEVARQRGLDPFSVIGPSRAYPLVRARMEVARILAERNYSFTQIGRALNRDHTMVSYYLGRTTKKHHIPPDPPKLPWSTPVVRDITPPKRKLIHTGWLIPYAGAEAAHRIERPRP